MKVLLMQVSLLAAIAVSLHGCATNPIGGGDRDRNPTIQDTFTRVPFFSVRTLNTFATTASRRVVIVSEDSVNPTDEEKKNNQEKGFFYRLSARFFLDEDNKRLFVCAEPPPDVGEAVASSVASGLKAAAKEPKSGITAELSDQYARTIATQIAPLLYRTQGVQFYRDGLHSLCIDRMNGWLGKDPETSAAAYQKLKDALRIEAAKLIRDELPVMKDVQMEFFKNVKAGFKIEDVKSLADIVKPVPATTTTTSTPTSTTTTTTPNPPGSSGNTPPAKRP